MTTLSWSQLGSYNKCARRWQFEYQHRIEPIPGVDSRSLLIGKLFHAGMAAALELSWLDAGVVQPSRWVRTAQKAVAAVFNTEVPQDVVVWDEQSGSKVPNVEFYDMANDAKQTVNAMLEYYIPRIGLNERYFVASEASLFKKGSDKVSLIEWQFETAVSLPGVGRQVFTGFVDAVLYDKQDDVYVIVDWKSRASFPKTAAAQIDGQLPFYLAILRSMKGFKSNVRINTGILWQFKTKTPSPASISVKNGLPNTGAASYDTTWDVWVKTLPLGINPEDYRELMMPKLKTHADFENLVVTVGTDDVCDEVLDTVAQTVAAMRWSIKTENFPAQINSMGCEYCPFKSICIGRRLSMDVSDTVNRYFRTKTPRTDETL